MNKYIFETKAREYGITPLPKDTVVTMAYVPYQTQENLEIFNPEQGMCEGTMFPELNKPFKPCSRYGGEKND